MNERLKIFVNHLILNLSVRSQADFASKIGVARSQISELLNGKRTISAKLINKIYKMFPELNRDWLTTGEGEMLMGWVFQNNKNGDNIQGNSVTINKPERDYLDIIKKLTSQLSKSQEQISKSQEQMDRLITIIENKL